MALGVQLWTPPCLQTQDKWSLCIKNVVDSKINTLGIRNVAETQSRLVRPKASVLLSPGSKTGKSNQKFNSWRARGIQVSLVRRGEETRLTTWMLGTEEGLHPLWMMVDMLLLTTVQGCGLSAGTYLGGRKTDTESITYLITSQLNNWSAQCPISMQVESLDLTLGKVSDGTRVWKGLYV